MNYQVITANTKWLNAPVVKPSDPTKVIVNVSVCTGIVGETYGFVKYDLMVAEFPISMTGTQMQAETIVQASAFSANKYPNT